jgi:hypothetical protein
MFRYVYSLLNEGCTHVKHNAVKGHLMYTRSPIKVLSHHKHSIQLGDTAARLHMRPDLYYNVQGLGSSI